MSTRSLAAGCVLLTACACATEGTVDPSRLRFAAQDSGATASLRGVCALRGGVAWASGSGGAVLRTVDGGASWMRLRVPDANGLDFRDVHALDRERAIVIHAGAPAVACRTEDGGRTWTRVTLSLAAGAFFDAFDFWDRRRGIAFSDPVGGSFLVVRTFDGGASWQEVPARALPVPIAGEAGFAASGSCLRTVGGARVYVGTGGGAARVLRSDDGGDTWTVCSTPMAHGESAGIFSLAFGDPDHGVAVGGDYRDERSAAGNAAWTEDGGRSWHAVLGDPPAGYRSAVAHLPGTEGAYLAVGPSGADLSQDGGRTWQPLAAGGFHALSIAPDGSGFAVGAEGRIARLAR